MNLYQASHQWSTRPADERFSSLAEMDLACRAYRQSALVTDPLETRSLRVEAKDGELSLVGTKGIPARLTHHAFGQLSGYSSAPAGYLRSLPATLAAQNLNHGLSKVAPDRMALLLHKNGDYVVRGMNSPDYTRIWNADVTARLLRLQEHGWQVPPARPAFDGQPGTRPATEADLLASGDASLGIKLGDPIAPAGLYASDHDMFAFLIRDDRRISEPGNPDGLARGFFVANAEVPGMAWWLMTFLYRAVCRNHIVWDVSGVTEIRIRHVGQNDRRAFDHIRATVTKYAEASAGATEAAIRTSRTVELGPDKDAVLDKLFGLNATLGLSRQSLDAAYQLAETHSDVDGSPRSPWGMAQGLTRLSQRQPYGDVRVKLDRAAGKVVRMAF